MEVHSLLLGARAHTLRTPWPGAEVRLVKVFEVSGDFVPPNPILFIKAPEFV